MYDAVLGWQNRLRTEGHPKASIVNRLNRSTSRIQTYLQSKYVWLYCSLWMCTSCSVIVDASSNDEAKDAIVVLGKRRNLLFALLVEREDDYICIFPLAKRHERSANIMKSDGRWRERPYEYVCDC